MTDQLRATDVLTLNTPTGKPVKVRADKLARLSGKSLRHLEDRIGAAVRNGSITQCEEELTFDVRPEFLAEFRAKQSREALAELVYQRQLNLRVRGLGIKI